MKQNEKILVYAVTGFLAVILGVAILFDKDTARRLPDVQGDSLQGPSLEDLMNRRATEPGSGAVTGAGAATDASKPTDAAGGAPPVVPGAADQPLAANVQLAPPAPAAVVTEKLGLSREEHGYRIVRATRGDTLGLLVQKWCGGLDRLEEARGLNETLETLQVGQTVVLPWVEDDLILAAWEKRTGASLPAPVFAPAPSAVDASSTPGTKSPVTAGASALEGVPVTDATKTDATKSAADTTAIQGAMRKHTIQAGESLWKIAEREVGKKQAPAFLDKVRALNPGLDVDRLREGQVISIPTKG